MSQDEGPKMDHGGHELCKRLVFGTFDEFLFRVLRLGQVVSMLIYKYAYSL